MTKRNKIIYWVSTIWLALGMVSTGAAQLSGMREGTGGVNMIKHLGYPLYFLTILGAWKIVGTIAVLVPGFPLIKEWAYAGFFFVVTGAIISHLACGDGAKEFFGAALLLILLAVSWFTRPMDRKFPRQTIEER